MGCGADILNTEEPCGRGATTLSNRRLREADFDSV